MKLWRFWNPSDYTFAQAGHHGSWVTPPGSPDGVCPECTASPERRAQPIIVDWDKGSDLVGDFTWAATDLLINDKVLAALVGVEGFSAGPVEFVQSPYEGSSLHELWPMKKVHLDRQRSSTELVSKCSICGHENWTIIGHESLQSRYDLEAKWLVRSVVSRVPGKGVFVDGRQFRGPTIFRMWQAPIWIFCTDDVRSLLLDQEFINLGFMEMGETF